MLVALLLGLTPADLAPGAPELKIAEARLEILLSEARATGAATARLQIAWTRRGTAGDACADTARLELGWRIERFGAAWREAAQAAVAQSERTRQIRNAPTTAPLVDSLWALRLDTLFSDAENQRASFLEASTWEVAFVRPTLGACPIVPAALDQGFGGEPLAAKGDRVVPVAVLATGDGWVCPQKARADDAIVLVTGGEACWSPDPACSCEPTPVLPGAVLGPAVVGE